MQKCAVIIGVNKTGKLPELFAAVKGAKDFKVWADNQGFETILITDENGKKVTVKEITDAVKGFVDKQTYSQMIIFFSGHGILKSAMDEQWLLSEAPTYANETVSVLASRMLARRSGIPHIVFISDACRSIPNDPIVTEVIGSVIFPNVAQNGKTDVDILYATTPGNPSYEVREDDAIAKFKGIYTDCLLKALEGNITTIIQDLKVADDVISTIPVYELNEYLQTAVPLAAASVSIMLSQIPDGEITSRLPKYLARIEREKEPVQETGIEIEALPTNGKETNYSYNKELNYKFALSYIDDLYKMSEAHTSGSAVDFSDPDSPIISLSKTGKDIAQNITALRNANGRASFETRTGFTIIGATEVEYFLPNDAHCDLFEEDGAIQIRVYEQPLARTLFLQMKDGTLIPLAILPGFIGTVVFKNGILINVNYVPSRQTPKYAVMQELQSEELEHRRALVATSAGFGTFKLEGDMMEVINQASYLRNIKAIDPTMGLYAAYAYAQAGSEEDVQSVYDYMMREPEPVLHDVYMLARISSPDITSNQLTAPFCPVLTQGWSYLSIDPTLVSTEVQELAKYLVPGLWTTFNPKALDHIKNLINTKQLL